MSPKSAYRSLLTGAALALLVAGCSSTSDPSTTNVDAGTTGVCTPGGTQSCTCTDGKSGSQSCQSDGSGYAPCVCSTAPCSKTNPGGTCGAGLACVAGACCASTQACGAACCAGGTTCVDDGSGNKLCAQTCTASSECPSAKHCCTLQADGTGACLQNALFPGQQCKCKLKDECASGACGQATDLAGNPKPAYVCTPNDGKPYHGCSGAPCTSGYCCLTFSNVGSICQLPCVNSTQCGGGSTCSALPGSMTCNGAVRTCQ